MKWKGLHHPDISIPVIRRRVSIELMEQLDIAADFMCHGAWALINRSCYPNHKAYANAIYRLQKRGLIVKHKPRGQTPVLSLSDEGKKHLPPYFAPQKAWNRKWHGIWYLLIYDVPESDRPYRDTLRHFLKKMGMGNLQQSVWITPTDIRADYHDLVKGAAIDSFAFLFESHTVLGLPKHRIVEEAWNFDRLNTLQRHYCSIMEENLNKLRQKQHDIEELTSLLRLALEAYHSIFIDDPLLPKALLPHDYQGERAYHLHQSLIQELNQQISHLNSRP